MNCSAPDTSLKVAPLQSARRSTRLQNPEVASNQSKDGVSNKKQKTQVRFPTELRKVSPMKIHISKLLKGADVHRTLSLRVLRYCLQLQEDYLMEKRKKAEARKSDVKPPAIRATVCRNLGISEITYSKIVNSYLQDRIIYVTGAEESGRSGNRTPKETRVPRTNKVKIMVRDWVRTRRAAKQRTTARQLVDFLLESKLIFIPRDEEGRFLKKEFKSALRSVQRWLTICRYQRGKRTGNIKPNPANLLKRHQYLEAFFKNRSKPEHERLREVYMDESYIHEHYHRNDDSIWDPGDEQDVQIGKSKHKGRRYCFACAIRGPNMKVSPNARQLEDRGGLVPGTVWAFCPQLKGAHTGDYHKVFNGQNFVKWWKEQLLPNLKEPSLIIIDNAKYHKVLPEGTPNPWKMKKEECRQYLLNFGYALEPELSALRLKEMVRQHIEKHVPIEVERLSKLYGHQVLFTPPHHSDFQPIELTWARIKGNVGRQYDANTTLQIVYERLMKEFELLECEGHQSVEGMIEKCASIAERFYDERDDVDDLSENGENDDDDEENDDEGLDNVALNLSDDNTDDSDGYFGEKVFV